MTINLSAVGGGGAKLWASGQTYAIGDQAISPSSLTLYIRKVAGAGTTDPAADSANWQPYGARAIKSIQRGSTTQQSGSITISSVNVAKSELRILSSGNNSIQTQTVISTGASFPGGYQWLGDNISLSLSSATTIAISGNLTGKTVSWELTEYY